MPSRFCVSLDGFTLHAATRAGAQDAAGREALLRYVLRPPLAQERVQPGPDGLVRIVLKKAYADGTFAVDMDPLSLLCRLATSVPPPRYHTIHYTGVLGPASQWRQRLVPGAPKPAPAASSGKPGRKDSDRYRDWAELLARTFAVDVLTCPRGEGQMKLLALVKDSQSIARYLTAVGEPTKLPPRSLKRGPPYGKSQVLRRRILADEDAEAHQGRPA